MLNVEVDDKAGDGDNDKDESPRLHESEEYGRLGYFRLITFKDPTDGEDIVIRKKR